MYIFDVAVLIENSEELKGNVDFWSKNASGKVIFHGFTIEDKAIEAISREKIKIFLVDENIEINKSKLPRNTVLIYLTGNANIESISGCRAIFKYQNWDEFYSQLHSIYYDNFNTEGRTTKGDKNATSVCTFMSPIGGVGTSTVSVAFADYMSRNKKEVLYVNFETFGCVETFFSGKGEKTISDIILKSQYGTTDFASLFSGYARCDKSGVHYLASASDVRDIYSLTSREISDIIKGIVNAKKYDFVVLNISCDLSEKMRTIMKCSNNIIVIDNGRKESRNVMEKLSDVIDKIEEDEEENFNIKISCLFNKLRCSEDEFKQIKKESKWPVIGGIGERQNDSIQNLVNIINNNSVFEDWL